MSNEEQIRKIAKSNFELAVDSVNEYPNLKAAIDSYSLNAAHTAKEAGLDNKSQLQAADAVYYLYRNYKPPKKNRK